MTESKTTAQPGGGPAYTLRKDGVDCVRSSLPGCGYTAQELKSLAAAGYELFLDGKKVKRGKTNA
jgi:hypothetical protein